MKKKYQNAFFIFGSVVLVIMVTQLDFKAVYDGLRHAGYWFIAVVLLWAVLYMLNTATWYTIIRSGSKEKPKISLPWLYKVTVSGFALNYATPGGLMGGEPYKIMALSPKIGTERASSSVILFAMTHIFTHFLFWQLSVFIYIITEPVNVLMGIILSAISAFCVLGIWFFMKGYQKGMAVRLMKFISHIPGIKGKAKGFILRHQEQLDTIDRQISSLHKQSRAAFVKAVLIELSCRFLSALEVMFVLLVLTPDVNFTQCVLILAFTSLFANLLFFMPLQLGGREGGFIMSATSLSLSLSTGIFVALIVRVRELVWTAIGLILIKMEKRKPKTNAQINT